MYSKTAKNAKENIAKLGVDIPENDPYEVSRKIGSLRMGVPVGMRCAVCVVVCVCVSSI